MENKLTVMILAAGKGTRMKSALPKGLHPIAGRPMLGHVLNSVAALSVERIVVVVGPGMESVSNYARSFAQNVEIAIQAHQRGTGDAVRAGATLAHEGSGVVLIIFGDTPLVRNETLSEMASACRENAPVVVLGFEAADPAGYGRLVLDAKGELSCIVEHKDASEVELALNLCNGGAMAIRAEKLDELLAKLTDDNRAKEFYLTDVVRHARNEGMGCVVVRAPEADIQGVNSRADLAQVEAEMQRRLRRNAMEAGVTLLDPDTVYLSTDTSFGQDVTVGQNVVFGPGVSVASGATIKPFSHLEGAKIGEGAELGPFARIRPGSDIGARAHIGNFVETKKARVEEGAKINHLSYIGDARVGARSNIGAGTITCNYDGFGKHFTDIGANAFVGSNTSLVAPVKIGEGAYIGSGSVITRDVGENALALERAVQIEKPGWAARFRAARRRKKEGA
jgi:bifunctional UDP-N-acetylglucosamine pyrophosphorylase/glucosamine-1-phosphate N-acetyltransferase